MKTIQFASLLILASIACAVSSANAADAATNYAKNCALCHGKDGAGKTMQGKKNKVEDFSLSKSDEQKMTTTIKEGVREGSKERMEAFGDKFTAEEIKDLVAYVRTFKK